MKSNTFRVVATPAQKRGNHRRIIVFNGARIAFCEDRNKDHVKQTMARVCRNLNAALNNG